MASLEDEIKRAQERGDHKVDGFTGAVRSLDVMSLEKGDIFTFPTDYEVYKTTFGKNKNTALYIFITTENGEIKQFFPSTFTKVRRVYDEDGKPTDKRVHTLGDAAELYRTKAVVKEAMDLMKGRRVKVTNMEKYRTLAYGTKDVVDCYIPTIDLWPEDADNATTEAAE